MTSIALSGKKRSLMNLAESSTADTKAHRHIVRGGNLQTWFSIHVKYQSFQQYLAH